MCYGDVWYMRVMVLYICVKQFLTKLVQRIESFFVFSV